MLTSHAGSRTSGPAICLQGEFLDDGTTGFLEDGTPLLRDIQAARQFEEQKGYLYLPGFFPREQVMRARDVFIHELLTADALDPAHEPSEGVLRHSRRAPGFAGGRLESLFEDWRVVHDLLYTGRMMQFFREFLGGEALHYDYTWTRQLNPGPGTALHSDVVYMGRGTHRLYTAWVPMGDAPLEMGGLVLLEGSHKHAGLAKGYWRSDVDAACTNRRDHRNAWQRGSNGSLHGKPNYIRSSLGCAGHWRTADYRAGDVVIFNVFTVHGGADNRTNRVRLSTDSRYQLAQDVADPRWVGERPPGHGPEARRELIC